MLGGSSSGVGWTCPLSVGCCVSGTVSGAEITSVDKTDTIYSPLYSLTSSLCILPYQKKNNHFDS